jgi:hypothetical protein
MADFPHAIFRKSIDIALLARQIELEPVGRRSDCLLRREPLDLDKHIKQFTWYKFTILYLSAKRTSQSLSPYLPRLSDGPTHDHMAARQQSTLGSR